MSVDMSLQDDALRLAELDRRLLRTVVEANVEEFRNTVAAYLTLRKSLKIRLLDEPVVSVSDADAREVLKKISGGDGLPSDKVIEQLGAFSGEHIPIDELDGGDFEQLGSELFYSWFSHFEYIESLAELRPLIVCQSVPKSVSRLVQQVKDCYAFQQYDAAYGLCRIVIEASIRDICVRCQLFPNLGENVILFAKFNWPQLRDKVSSGPLRKRLESLYSDLSVLVHGRKTVTRKEARDAFEETLQVVEQLYAAHGL